MYSQRNAVEMIVAIAINKLIEANDSIEPTEATVLIWFLVFISSTLTEHFQVFAPI